jgi:hypothetical protein
METSNEELNQLLLECCLNDVDRHVRGQTEPSVRSWQHPGGRAPGQNNRLTTLSRQKIYLSGEPSRSMRRQIVQVQVEVVLFQIVELRLEHCVIIRVDLEVRQLVAALDVLVGQITGLPARFVFAEEVDDP